MYRGVATPLFEYEMLKDLDLEGLYVKSTFDGYDFVQTEIGQRLVSPKNYDAIYRTTFMSELYDKVEEFLTFCKFDLDGYLPKDLMYNYNCGCYRLADAWNKKNPWYGKKYVLFNKAILSEVFKHTRINKNTSFWVCPSYGENNKVEAIGFRVKNEKDVLGAFKWIFTCGNNIIYGKNTVDKNKPCYIVEGYRDYIALNESGINCIGLGSVVISKQQEEYINTLKEPIVLLDNDSFGLHKTMQYKSKYRVATLVGTKEKDAWDAYCNEGIKICEIK